MLQQGYYGGGPSGGAAETNVGDVEDTLIYIYIIDIYCTYKWIDDAYGMFWVQQGDCMK
jgi:hypothetical protein